jgi:paraquat-inducible protein B
MMTRLVAQGMRARLGTENLLTGQRMIALDFDPDAKKAALGDGDIPELPAGDAGDIDSLTRAASHAMEAVASMPLKDIGDSLHALLAHLDQLVGSPDAKQTVHSLNATLGNLDKLTQSLNADAPALVKSLRETADAATRTLDVLGGQGGRGTDLRGLLHELEETARSMRSLADMLQEHPEALLRGREGEAK